MSTLFPNISHDCQITADQMRNEWAAWMVMMHADDVMAAPFLRRVVRVQGSAIVYKYADTRNLVDTRHAALGKFLVPACICIFLFQQLDENNFYENKG